MVVSLTDTESQHVNSKVRRIYLTTRQSPGWYGRDLQMMLCAYTTLALWHKFPLCKLGKTSKFPLTFTNLHKESQKHLAVSATQLVAIADIKPTGPSLCIRLRKLIPPMATANKFL